MDNLAQNGASRNSFGYTSRLAGWRGAWNGQMPAFGRSYSLPSGPKGHFGSLSFTSYLSVESKTTPSREARVARSGNAARDRTSQPDPFYLTQCNLVLCPVIEFGCSRRLMPRHLLGVLEPSVVLQVNRDTGCPPGVTSNGGKKTRRLGPLTNRSPGVVPVQSPSRYLRSKRINALEQGLATLETCGHNVLVQYFLEQVMHGHLVLLAAFFVESQSASGAIVIVIIELYFQYRAYTGEAVEHRGNERPVP